MAQSIYPSAFFKGVTESVTSNERVGCRLACFIDNSSLKRCIHLGLGAKGSFERPNI